MAGWSNYPNGMNYDNDPQPTDTHGGWTIEEPNAENGGHHVVRRPDGTKYGQTQTMTAAQQLRRNGRRQETQIWSPELGDFIDE